RHPWARSERNSSPTAAAVRCCVPTATRGAGARARASERLERADRRKCTGRIGTENPQAPSRLTKRSYLEHVRCIPIGNRTRCSHRAARLLLERGFTGDKSGQLAGFLRPTPSRVLSRSLGACGTSKRVWSVVLGIF